MAKKVKCLKKHDWRETMYTKGSFDGWGYGRMGMRICRKCSHLDMVSFEGQDGKITLIDSDDELPGSRVP